MLIAHGLGPAWALGCRHASWCCEPASVTWVTRAWEVEKAAPLPSLLYLAPFHLVALWVPQAIGEQGKLVPGEPFCGSCLCVRLGHQL